MKLTCIETLRAAFRAGAAPAGNVVGTLGSVTLRPGQLETLSVARRVLSEFGGALIADDVGAGKTYVALALAREAGPALIIAPAVLRSMWDDACARAGQPLRFVSVEALSGGNVRVDPLPLVIIDEAHHLRNPDTKRYANVQRLTERARLVLLSATPVHNNDRDLDALLALFLHESARDLDEERRARVIVRATAPVAAPPIQAHEPMLTRDVPGVVDAVLRLPPAFGPRDAGDAPALVRMSLLRAWCSSVAALDAMLRRAILGASAVRDALAAGRHPTRAELATGAADEAQLGFADLIPVASAIPADAVAHVDRYLAALVALREHVRNCASLDDERAIALRGIVSRHDDCGVLICTQYAATVEAMWRRLRFLPGVAALTARGGRIASGPASREDVLACFAPSATGARTPHPRERIRVLIATDLVSEGLNLQDAGTVVHLDTPWTAARLAQRVGRVARPGSSHSAVHVYSVAPPRAVAAVLALDKRLRAKQAAASHLVGGAARAAELLGDVADARVVSAAEARARIAELLKGNGVTGRERASSVVCAIAAPEPGWLALFGDGDRRRIVARIGPRPVSTDPRLVVQAVEWLMTHEACTRPHALDEARADAGAWLDAERARELAHVPDRHAARARHRDAARVIGAVATSAPHLRVRTAADAGSQFGSAAPPRLVTAPRSLRALAVFCVHGHQPSGSPVRP
ncbi:MAG TPA: DEAD/DEAH box helicase [Gemmatimonadaceae bacterium]|nr:DEAD/DEAH box helicase [Gemmatimonadaceae bacterium]